MTVPTVAAPPALVTIRSSTDGFEPPVRHVFEDFILARRFAEEAAAPGHIVTVRQRVDLRRRGRDEDRDAFNAPLISLHGEDLRPLLVEDRTPLTWSIHTSVADTRVGGLEVLHAHFVQPICLQAGHWMMNNRGRAAFMPCTNGDEQLDDCTWRIPCSGCTSDPQHRPYGVITRHAFDDARGKKGRQFLLTYLPPYMLRSLAALDVDMDSPRKVNSLCFSRHPVSLSPIDPRNRIVVDRSNARLSVTAKLKATLAHWLALHDPIDTLVHTPNLWQGWTLARR